MSSPNPPAVRSDKPMPSLEAFIGSLEKSRLVSVAQIAEIKKFLGGRQDIKSTALARWLVEKRFLSGWQAEELLGGKTHFHLQKYKLLERIGSGANGTVFKAEQTGMNRIVALKLMPEDLAKKPESVARFKQETRLAANLHHPHIITAYDAECDGDTHFLVMEYMDGKDLNQWINDHAPLPVRWACECIRQAALGLQHAHEKGLVHRDIKPGNLLASGKGVQERPTLKVLDMGFARNTNDEGGVRLTKAWQIFGTPDYMAPEQAESTLSADIRCDIFSLGVTLFKLLTAQLPFKGETPVQKLMSRANNDAPRVGSMRKDVPPVLDAVVAKMLARKPELRYQTPSEVVAALEPFGWDGSGQADMPAPASAAGEPVGAIPPTGPDSTAMPSITMGSPSVLDQLGGEMSIGPGISAIRRGASPLRPAGMPPVRGGDPPPSTGAVPAPTETPAPAPQAAEHRTFPMAERIRETTYLGLALGTLVGLALGGVPAALVAALLWKSGGLAAAAIGASLLLSGLALGLVLGGMIGLLRGISSKP